MGVSNNGPAPSGSAVPLSVTACQAVAPPGANTPRKILPENTRDAIEFGLLAISSVLHTLILEEEPPAGIRAPEQFEEELTRMFLGYLGVSA